MKIASPTLPLTLGLLLVSASVAAAPSTSYTVSVQHSKDGKELSSIQHTGTDPYYVIPQKLKDWVCAVGPTGVHDDGVVHRSLLCVHRPTKATLSTTVDCNQPTLQGNLQAIVGPYSLSLWLSCKTAEPNK